MTREEILSHVDHTLLKPEATWPQIKVICDEAVENHTASICINTCYVKQAVEYLAGRIPVCCVVGFPLGAMDTESKAFEAKKAIENGASEVDMVINIGRLKNKEYDAVREDIRAVKQAVGDKVLKVIIETCLLTEGDTVIRSLADYSIELPATLECLDPLVASIPLQLLAYYIAALIPAIIPCAAASS